MKRKDILQWIKREAKKIPDEGYLAREYYDKAPKVGNEEPHFANQNGKVFTVQEYKVNHARRLKNIWDKTESFEELDKYFNKYGLQLNYKK